MGRVYAVASGKGGVGKTATTVNIGAVLAASGRDVAVVDADLGMANLAPALGVSPTGPTLHDVLAGDASVADATYDGPEGLAVIPGSVDLSAYAGSDPMAFDDVLDDLTDYEFVLVDTGASLTHANVRPMALADAVLLVSTTERDALRGAEKTREVTDRVGGSVAGAVLTRVDPANPNAEEVTATLHADVLEAVPEDPAVGAAIRAGEPLVLHSPDAPATDAYRNLAAEVAELKDGGNGREADPIAVPTTAGDAPQAAENDDAEAETDVDDAASVDSDADVETEGESVDDEDDGGDPDGGAAEETGGDEMGADEAEDETDEVEADAVDADEAEEVDDAGDDEMDADETEDTEGDAGADADAEDAADDPSAIPFAGADDDEGDESTDETDDADSADPDDVGETVLAGGDGSDGGLVEEAEPGGDVDADADDADVAASSGGVTGVPDAEAPADEETEADEESDERKGFFSRLLG